MSCVHVAIYRFIHMKNPMELARKEVIIECGRSPGIIKTLSKSNTKMLFRNKECLIIIREVH